MTNTATATVTVTNHGATSEAMAVACDAGVPVVLTGPPGCGKTAAVKELAAQLRRPVLTIIASLREPSDFAGLPIVEGRETFLAPPSWARQAAKAERPIVFLDEVSTAPQSVQAALLRVVDEGVVGDLALPPGTSFIAAMNPPDSAAGGWDLAPAFANRWLHLEWRGWDSRQWAVWAAGQGWGRAADVVGAFLIARPSLLHAMPADQAQRGEPWPSHRTWARACKVLSYLKGDLVGPVGVSLVTGCVGSAALELAEYVRELDLPDPRDLLANPSSWVVPARSDRIWATLNAVCRVVTDTGDPKLWEQAWSVMQVALEAGHGDLAVSACGPMARSKPKAAKVPKSLAAFLPLLEAAGMLTGGSR